MSTPCSSRRRARYLPASRWPVDAERRCPGPRPTRWARRVARPMPRLDLVVGEDAEGRDDVLGEVLVLVVAPHDDDVRPELVEELARVAEVADEARRGGRPPRRCRRRRRTRAASASGQLAGIAVALGQAGVLEHACAGCRPCSRPADERRVVRHAQAEDLAHVVPPRGRRQPRGAYPTPGHRSRPTALGAVAGNRASDRWRSVLARGDARRAPSRESESRRPREPGGAGEASWNHRRA